MDGTSLRPRQTATLAASLAVLVAAAVLPVVPAGAKKVTIRFCSFQTGEVVNTWKKQFNEYEKLTGVKVIHEIVPWGETLSRHLTYMAGGISRDCAMVTAAYARALAANGLLVDLNSLVGKLDPTYKFDDFWPKLLDVYKYKGRSYALPSDLDLGLMWYNADMFSKAGLPFPDGKWDWNEFTHAMVKLTTGTGAQRQYGTTGYPWEIALWQNEATVLNDEGTQCTIDTPEAEKALQFIVDLLLKYKVVGGSFENGKAGTNLGPGPYYAWYGLKAVKFKWGVTELPRGKVQATTAWGSSFAILKGCKNIPETWKFLKWFLSPEKQAQRANDFAWFPPGKKATQLPGFVDSDSMMMTPAQKQMVIRAVSYGRAPTIIRRQDDMVQLLGTELSKAFSGKVSVRQATTTIKQKAASLLK